MSFLTTRVLGSAPSWITGTRCTSATRSNMVRKKNFRGDQPTNSNEKKSAGQPHCPDFVRLSNCSWRGASRRPNGRELNERPVSGAAPANRAFKLTDAGYSRTRRAPDILRRSLTPVR
jgi:hypothetical protein